MEMGIIALLAENKIREAIRKGELDNLAGRGKPLELEDLSNVPEHLRAAYIILRNADVLPEEVGLRKEIVSLQKLMNCCSGPDEKNAIEQKLTQKVLRFEILMEKRGINPALGTYKDKIHQKFGGAGAAGVKRP